MKASRLPGFYKLPLAERRAVLADRFGLSRSDLAALGLEGGLAPETADHMVENAVGVLGLPLGLGLNFIVDGTPVLVPMAVEEPSVIAACSSIARLAGETGGFEVSTDPAHMVGQIQLIELDDPAGAAAAIRASAAELMAEANLLCPGLVDRGGGCVDIEVRTLSPLVDGPHAELDSDDDMLVVHVMLDCRDAMGANAINTVVEGLAPVVERLSGGRACLRILSNLCDRRRARASMALPYAGLASKGAKDAVVDGRRVAQGIVDAYRFAARDPYRACTHNKGILNGIDAVAIATGNDWRAIEAGAHAYAASSGQYTSLSKYWLDDDAEVLRASIELPLAVGVVGGATRVHPTVRACRKLLGEFAQSAAGVASVMASVGLAQNCAALKAMATEGIQRGHMSLHARQVALAAGAEGDEVDTIARVLVEERCYRPARAAAILDDLREDDQQAPAGSQEARP